MASLGASRPAPKSSRLRPGWLARPERPGSPSANRSAWLLASPAVGFLLAIGVVPALVVLYLSFGRSVAGHDSEFVGLANYGRLLSQGRFLHSILVTVVLGGLGLVAEVGLGLVLATALDVLRPRVRRLATTMIIIPMLITPVVIGILFRLLLRPRNGLVNYILELLGIGPIPWFQDGSWAFVALLIADIWQWTPFLTVILLAGLQSQPEEVLEASMVDGATARQRFAYITLPLLRPILALAIALRAIDAFKALDLVYVLTRGGPASATETVGFLTYLNGFTYFDLGLTAAMSVIQLIIVTIVFRVGFVRIFRGGASASRAPSA